MATAPLLKQVADLSPADIELHPVWVHCHIVDYDEPWYDETDEETFRPWPISEPIDNSGVIYLFAAEFKLPDGSPLPGFVTPPEPGIAPGFGRTQPTVFVGNEAFRFWRGMFSTPRDVRERFYHLIGRPPAAVFPISFRSRQGLTPEVTGSIPGFMSSNDSQTIVET